MQIFRGFLLFCLTFIVIVKSGYSATNYSCVSTDNELLIALNNAALSPEDDEIQLVQGVYTAEFVYSSSNLSDLSIKGGYTANCAGRIPDRENTILDGSFSHRALGILSTGSGGLANISLDALTLRNGKVSVPGGGGYIKTQGGTVTLTRMAVSGNTITNSSGGGGVYIDTAGGVVVSGNVFSNNSTGGIGGGLYIYKSENSELADNVFALNSTASQGGGAYINANSTATIVKNSFSENQSANDSGGAMGVSTIVLNVEGNFLSNNTKGGGININYKSGMTDIRLLGNMIINNQNGPGIRAGSLGGSNTIIANNVIARNSAYNVAYGGGISLNGGPGKTTEVTNNTVSENYSPGNGGGILMKTTTDTGVFSLYSNIVWDNDAAGMGADMYIDNDGNNNLIYSPVVMLNNDFDQTTQGLFIKEPSFPLFLDPSNLNNANPFFVAASDDYRLNENSPCINKGSNFSPGIQLLDLAGNPRVMAGVADIGAFEYPGAILPVAVFEANQLAGETPLTVSFNDASLGVISSWLWDFGDGATSTLQNPTHIYTETGTFTVSLTVTGDEGSTTETKPGLISVSLAPPVAEAGPDRVIAQNIVTLDGSGSQDVDGSIVSYSWTLTHRDDSAYNKISYQMNPLFSDLHYGFYDIVLTVTDNDALKGTDTMVLCVAEPWDINNDQRIGLEEAIHILRAVTLTK